MACVTAFHVTLIVFEVAGAAKLAATPAGAEGRTVAWLSPLLPAPMWAIQFVAGSAGQRCCGSEQHWDFAMLPDQRGFTACCPGSHGPQVN